LAVLRLSTGELIFEQFHPKLFFVVVLAVQQVHDIISSYKNLAGEEMAEANS
jgi:hypothetical protein